MDKIGRTIILNPGTLKKGGLAVIEINNGKVNSVEIRGNKKSGIKKQLKNYWARISNYW